jgi:hypothetical protein
MSKSLNSINSWRWTGKNANALPNNSTTPTRNSKTKASTEGGGAYGEKGRVVQLQIVVVSFLQTCLT